MLSLRRYCSFPLFALALLARPAVGQIVAKDGASVGADADEENENRPGLLFGVAAGALSYQGGREEQALGAVVRWNATPWFALSTTPTMVRVRQPAALAGAPMESRAGLVDLPVDATLSRSFPVRWTPGIALSLGVSLPLGDTASGFGAGSVGYSASAGLGFSPSDRVWVHLGAGRSLTDVTMRSAFSSGSGWGDLSAGLSLTERFSINGGVGTDLGAVDSTIGHSTSIDGGLSMKVLGPSTFNLNASHGVSGLAPRWSFALGFGTAFPYLNHLGAGSPMDQLVGTFGGGTHGLGKGTGSGTVPGRGRGRKTL